MRNWEDKAHPWWRELRDGTSAVFRSWQIPTWTPFGSYTGMPGARMLQDLLCGTEHLLRQPREQSSKEKGSTTVPKCSTLARELSLPWKIPMSLEAAEHRSEQWEVKWGFIFKQQCSLMCLVPDKQRRTQSRHRTLQLKRHQHELWAWVPLLEINPSLRQITQGIWSDTNSIICSWQPDF